MGFVAAFDKEIFYNPTTRYAVLQMKTADIMVPQEARSPYKYKDHLIRFTAVGCDLPRNDAVKMELTGIWANGRHGLQFEVEQWNPDSRRFLFVKAADGFRSLLLVRDRNKGEMNFGKYAGEGKS